jgi:hypothetical protein
MCPSLSKKNIIKNHLNRLKQGEGLLKIFAITKLKTYYANALPCVTRLGFLDLTTLGKLENYKIFGRCRYKKTVYYSELFERRHKRQSSVCKWTKMV